MASSLLCRTGIRIWLKKDNQAGDIRRLDVPSTQVEPDHRDEPFDRVIDCGHGEKSVGVRHEAIYQNSSVSSLREHRTCVLGCSRVNVLGDSFQHRPGLKDECREHDPTQIGARSQLRDDVREDWPGVSVRVLRHSSRSSLPFPCSGSTTSSSPLALESSTDDLPGCVSDSDILSGRGG